MFAQNPSLLLFGTSSGIPPRHRGVDINISNINTNTALTPPPPPASDDDKDAAGNKPHNVTSDEGGGMKAEAALGDIEGVVMKLGVRKSVVIPAATQSSPAAAANNNNNSSTAGIIKTTTRQRRCRSAAAPPRKEAVEIKSKSTRRQQRSVSPSVQLPVNNYQTVKKDIVPSAPIPRKHQQYQQQQRRSVSAATTVRTMMTSSVDREQSMRSRVRGITPKLGDTQRGERMESFIDSITFCDEDPWRPPAAGGKGKAHKKSDNKLTAPLKPLPRHTLRQLYAEDVTPFERKEDSSSSAAFPPQLSLTALQSAWERLGESDGCTDVRFPHSASLSLMEGESSMLSKGMTIKMMSTRSLHTWNEPPSNVVLPNGKTQLQKKREENGGGGGVYRDVWYPTSEINRNRDEKRDWMRPLQEIGKTESNSVLKSSRSERGTYPRGLNDDDYQALFNSLEKVHAHCHHHHHSSDGLNKFMTQTKLERLQGFTNSFAACSALLQQPQHLLDSEHLQATATASSMRSRRSVRQPSSLFSWGKSGVPMFQTTGEGPQFVELSNPAKVLFAAVLYLRTLGGFPTLLRISPLKTSSVVVGKEHCVELVFSSPSIPQADPKQSADPTQITRTRYTSMLNVMMDGRQPPEGGKLFQGKKTTEGKERSVIIRSIIAEKTTVNRFGKTEVVHVLHPIKDDKASTADGSRRGDSKKMLAARSTAVYRLIHDSEAGSNASESSQPPRNPQFHGKDIHNLNRGDLAVVFLMSGGLSKISGVPPEPMDMEALRYKVYALRQGELDNATKKEGIYTSTPQKFTQRQQQQRSQQSNVGFNLSTKEAKSSSTLTAAAVGGGLPAESTMDLLVNQRRFPSYHPISVAESTLAAMANAATGGDEGEEEEDNPLGREYHAQYFCQLRLPCLYTDLVDAIQYALDVQDRLKTESVTRSRFF